MSRERDNVFVRVTGKIGNKASEQTCSVDVCLPCFSFSLALSLGVLSAQPLIVCGWQNGFSGTVGS